ncbi:MAG: M20/M25/M40 family metallo-hydrolase [Anaerolineae bacterium]|nr:M20/M25/M40 family metallo-hydrolase [Anaerolineae bacterium]
MPLDLQEHLRALCVAPAPSGHEGPVRAVIQDAWEGRADELRADALGNLIAVKRGGGPEPRRSIMLCAHMDEIGLIVAEVREGFIRTAPLGGIDYRALLAQPVLVHGRRALKGLFGAAPPHMARSRDKYPAADDLWVDVGLPADEVAALVRVGDIITVDAPAVPLKGDHLAAKSLDNRLAVAVVTLCLDELTRRDHAWDVVGVAAVQEEVGSYGALAAAYQIAPDIAIAIDGSYGVQTGVGDDEGFALGDGPTIARGPNFHPLLVRALHAAAADLEIDVQIEPTPGHSGTDAWEIQVSREGVPTGLIGVPMRNMHTPAEVVNLRDVTRAGRLLAGFIAGLTPDFLDTLAWPEAAPRKERDA